MDATRTSVSPCGNFSCPDVRKPSPLVLYPDYIHPYNFELYDYQSWYQWMGANWQVSLYASALYLLLVKLGTSWMKEKRPYSLKGPLIVWNIFLSIGSAVMFLRISPELYNFLINEGWKASVCKRDGHTVISSFWCLVFTLSKIVEFGDTAFIILRKQKLIFLHWYHHITVAFYTFYSFREFDPTSRYYGTMNTFVHAFMYGYYTLRVLGFKIPRPFAMGITIMQIVQMFIGFIVTASSLYYKIVDKCDGSLDNIILALLMYGSYIVLFLNFFRNSYFRTRTPETKKIN